MSLSSLGGVLVDTPSDLSVQSLLATHSNLLSQTAFLPSPTTEITLDEDDVFQCGRCKEVFTSFHQFMLHKQDHQTASSSSKILNETLALNISRDLNHTLNSTASNEHEAESCLSSTQLLKDPSCDDFDLPESLRVSGQNNTNNVLSYSSLDGSTFDDLSDEIGQPLMLSGTDSLNFPIEQSILNLNNATELTTGSYPATSMSHLEASLLPHKLLSDENCASNNNVWLPAQKDDSSNSNFITSEFTDEQNFFVDTKKVSDTVNFSNHNLLTEISYSEEKLMYQNEAPTNSEDISVSGSLPTAVLPSEQMLLETSKDYLRSCQLLEEFESTNQHGLLESATLETSDVMGISLPLLSDSSVVSSLRDSSTPNFKASPLVPLASQQIEENYHSFENESNVLQEDCGVLHSSLEMDCTAQEHNGHLSSCNSSRSPCSLLVCVCQPSEKHSSFDAECDSCFKNTQAVTEVECSEQNGNEPQYISTIVHDIAQPAEPCESIPKELLSMGGNRISEVETKQPISEEISSTENDDKFNPEYSCQDLQFKQSDRKGESDSLGCDEPEVDCNFNSDLSFSKRSKHHDNLKSTKSCYLRSDTWDEDHITLRTKEARAPETPKSLTQVKKSLSKSENGSDLHFEVCSVASIMKEIGILDSIDKDTPNEDSSAVEITQDQERTILDRSNLFLKPQMVWKSGDGSNDNLWPSVLDHDYQLVQKDALNSDVQEDSLNEQSNCNNAHDEIVIEEAQSKIETDTVSELAVQNSLSTKSDSSLSGVQICETEHNFERENIISKHETPIYINLNKLCDDDSSLSKHESILSDCDTSNSCNAFNECNFGNSDVMSVELFNDVSHPNNIMVELECDSNQSNIIFIDHGNFVGEQEIILSEPHGDSNEECTSSTKHEEFSMSEDNGTCLGTIALEDKAPLQIPPNWTKQESFIVQDQKQNVVLNEAKSKKCKDSHLIAKRNAPVWSGDIVLDQHYNLLPNSVASNSVERENILEKEVEFERMCLPSVDLYDCVSVVCSAYEEESTTFSKLWNPDIRLSSELFHLETDINDAVEDLPQQRLLSKKNKRNRPKVEKFQTTQKSLYEVPLVPSIGMKSTEAPISMSKRNMEVAKDGSVPSSLPPTIIQNRYKEVMPPKTLKMQKKSSQLSLVSTIPINLDENSSSAILYDTGCANSSGNYLNHGSSNDSIRKSESPSPASASLLSTKAAKVRENLWEKRTPKLSCELCDKKFAKFFDLRQHMRSHTGEKPFQCVVCGRSFTQKSNLTKHLRTHKIWSKSVSTLSKNAIQKVCHKKKGASVTTTESVVFEDKDDEKNLSSSFTIAGDLSPASSSDSAITSRNQELQHNDDGWEIISEECIVDSSYICQFCGASFVTYFELKTHRKTHQDEKVFFCPRNNCQKTFPDLESFVLHVNNHAPAESFYPCNICGETFLSRSEKTYHMELHSTLEKSTTKKYCAKCQKCKSTFLSQEALENHLRTVSHDLPCPECKRIFSCERSLRRHLRTHSTIHPFVCKECGKRFKTALYLNTHLAMHRDDKPFACSQCPAKFARKDRLSRHLKIHSDGECCPFQAHLKCNRQFTRPDKLKAHVLSHTEHQSINCTFCKRQIAKFSVNKRHYQTSNEQEFI